MKASGELRRLFAEALAELDLGDRVSASLPSSRGKGAPWRVLAIGKGAPAMAMGAIVRFQSAIERCLVVAPDGTDTRGLVRAARAAKLGDRLELLHASHPLPDARSVRAGEACLDFVATEERRRILVLVSGGASSLACAPAAGITLRTKRAVTRALIQSGASVQELNVVRKHLSCIKGGGLLRAAGSNEVLTRIASDVIGGTAADVGSGPSVPDPRSSVVTARRILRQFVPSYADLPLARSPRASAPVRSSRAAQTAVVASPEDLARLFARLLRRRGVVARVLPPSQSPATELAAEYIDRARRALARDGAPVVAFVRAAEPSVIVPARARSGRGGRSTHLAALVGRALASLPGRRPVVFAALASDGVDGTSGCAGAIVDRSFAPADSARVERAIAAFDTGPLHLSLGTALPERPSGHNLADLHVLLVGMS